jgi:hypothetical protein
MTGFRVTASLVARAVNRSWPVSSHLPYIFLGECSVSVITCSPLEGVGYAASPFCVVIPKFLKSVFSDCVLRLFHDVKILYNWVKICFMYTRGEMVNIYITLVRRSEGKKPLVKRSCR